MLVSVPNGVPTQVGCPYVYVNKQIKLCFTLFIGIMGISKMGEIMEVDNNFREIVLYMRLYSIVYKFNECEIFCDTYSFHNESHFKLLTFFISI